VVDPRGTVAEAGERALVDRLRDRLGATPGWLVTGPGDDAAVVESVRGRLEVLTTDALVEGVHFDRRFMSPADVGFRALAVNLSDLAAMGATPRLALLSLALPDSYRLSEFDDLIGGFLELAARARMALAGGNITRSPGPLVVDVMAVGCVKRRRALERRGARPGDALFVSGTIGAAAAGLDWLRSRVGPPGRDDLAAEPCGDMQEPVRRYRRPEPRLRLGRALADGRAATACIDLSDGLADGVQQLAVASGIGFVVDAVSVPVDPAARAWFERAGVDPLQAAMSSDDYELLFTVSSRTRGPLAAVQRLTGGVALARIGTATREAGLTLRRESTEEPIQGGFRHFGPAPR
jgi:thiamine-monophosphate kinase